MKKHLSIFLGGLMILAPIGGTIFLLVWLGGIIDSMGRSFLPDSTPPGIGVVVLVTAIYLVGLLGKFWLFNWFFKLVDALFLHVPGIKTIYESIRDLFKLFGGDAKKMGRVVKYTFPDTKLTVLGVLTNENPPAGVMADGTKTATVYLPFSYMIGGVTVYAKPEEIEEVDMPVEEAMKLCAIAFVSGNGDTEKQP